MYVEEEKIQHLHSPSSFAIAFTFFSPFDFSLGGLTRLYLGNSPGSFYQENIQAPQAHDFSSLRSLKAATWKSFQMWNYHGIIYNLEIPCSVDRNSSLPAAGANTVGNADNCRVMLVAGKSCCVPGVCCDSPPVVL